MIIQILKHGVLSNFFHSYILDIESWMARSYVPFPRFEGMDIRGMVIGDLVPFFENIPWDR